MSTQLTDREVRYSRAVEVLLPASCRAHGQSPEFKFRFVFSCLQMLSFSALCGQIWQQIWGTYYRSEVISSPTFCSFGPQRAEIRNIWRGKNTNLNLTSGLCTWYSGGNPIRFLLFPRAVWIIHSSRTREKDSTGAAEWGGVGDEVIAVAVLLLAPNFWCKVPSMDIGWTWKDVLWH